MDRPPADAPVPTLSRKRFPRTPAPRDGTAQTLAFPPLLHAQWAYHSTTRCEPPRSRSAVPPLLHAQWVCPLRTLRLRPEG